MTTVRRLTFGFPTMHKEVGERRDFLPPLIRLLADLGCDRSSSTDRLRDGLPRRGLPSIVPRVRVVDEDAAFDRTSSWCSGRRPSKLEKLRRGATLISMLHFPTRPARRAAPAERGVEAVGLDTIEDDEGRRLVVNSKAVAWNGLEAAFAMLERRWPLLTDPARAPVRVTVMGAGEIGKHAVEAATKYGNAERSDLLMRYGVPGVEVVDDRTEPDLRRQRYLEERLRPPTCSSTRRSATTLRPADPERLARPASAEHAVICDLRRRSVPAGRRPADGARHRGHPPGEPRSVHLRRRRSGVGRASVPGGRDRQPPGGGLVLLVAGRAPARCMELYGGQLAPLLEMLVERGGMPGIVPTARSTSERSPAARSDIGGPPRAWSASSRRRTSPSRPSRPRSRSCR